MKLIFTFFYIFSFQFIAFSQVNENYSKIWYFGKRAGIEFTKEGPITLTDGRLNTQEGVATVSDSEGKLLFYTDGVSVWDKNHVKMPNGDHSLHGNWSSTQSALILPNPEKANLFYIFTTDQLGGAKGFSYSTVDLNLPGNGTLENPGGDVVALGLNTQLILSVTEKITAVLKGDGEGYWVLAHGWNNNYFYAFEVTAKGVNPEPVISEIGKVHSGGNISINSVGQMKASPNGRNLALANRSNGTIDLYHFDSLSGKVMNELSISPRDKLLYGLDFSADSEFLFIGGKDQILRYKLSDRSFSYVTIDMPSVLEQKDISLRALQLGPDGKIYASVKNYDHLSVIHNPIDENPLLKMNGVYLNPDEGGRHCSFGLPNIIFYKIEHDLNRP